MSSNTFVAIDFETATKDRMACQIGIVCVADGTVVERQSFLIKPPLNKYDECCVKVHHITPDKTADAPSFDELWPKIQHYFLNNIVVAHNAQFDCDVLYKNLNYYGIMVMGTFNFRCTCDLFRRKGLHDLCLAFGMDCSGHHDALFDAECCAAFYLNYLNGIEPDYTLIPPKNNVFIAGEPVRKRVLKGEILEKDLSSADPNNPFYDRRIVITGEFHIDRMELARTLKSMGADINTSITKKTNFVLVGKDPGPTKMEKLNKLIHDGYNIRIIYQSDLIKILEGDWCGYAVENVVKKDLDFTYDHFVMHHKPFNGLVNHIASKNLYLGKGLAGNIAYFAQIAGNLGAASDNEIFSDTNICVLSDATLDNLKRGIKDETVKYIQDTYNSAKSILFDWTFISESDLLDYCKKRCLEYHDEVTMELYEKYMESAFIKIEQKNKYEFKPGKNYCKVNGKIVLKMEDGTTWCPSRQFRGDTYNISDN